MNTINKGSFPAEVLETVENLIRFYLMRRRKTVIQAMLELHPRMVIGLHVEGIVGIKDIPAYHRFFEKIHVTKDTQFRGIWRDVWDFRLHGYGCELIHRQTKEHFDWDLSETNCFYIYEFFHHLLWRIQKNRDKDVENYLHRRNFIEVEGLRAIFIELEKQNKLEYIKFEDWIDERERLPSGDWVMPNMILDDLEQWME